MKRFSTYSEAKLMRILFPDDLEVARQYTAFVRDEIRKETDPARIRELKKDYETLGAED